MPRPRRKFVCGKVDILSLFGVGFLTLSLIAIAATAANPQIKQIFQPKASCSALCLKNATREECGCTRTSQNQGGGGTQTAATRTSQNQGTTNSSSSSGKGAPAPAAPAPAPVVNSNTITTNVTTPGAFGYIYPGQTDRGQPYIAGTYIADNGQRYLIQSADTAKAATKYAADNPDAVKNMNFNPDLLNSILPAAPAAAPATTNLSSGNANDICVQDGGTIVNGICQYSTAPASQPASNPINTPFSAPNMTECKDAAGSTYDFNYSGGKCTLTQKSAPQSAPASQPAPVQPSASNNSLLNIATGNTSNQTDVNQVRNQCNSDKASGQLPSTSLKNLDCGLGFDLQQYALGKLQAAAPTTFQQAQQTNTTNLQQMGDCIRGGGTWLNNNTCQAKQIAAQPTTTITVTPQQGLSIKMQTGGICLFPSDCESGNCSAGTCKASAPIVKYPQITMTQLNACTGSGGQIDLSTGKCAYSPIAQQNLDKLKSQCQNTQGCYWDAYTNQPINTGVPGIINTLTFGQFSNTVGKITELNQQYNSTYGTANYKPVITPGGFNDTSANLQLAGTIAKATVASAPVSIVGGATLAFGGELAISTVTGAAAAGVPVSTYVAAQAGALTTTAVASSPLWLQQTIQTVSPYVAPVLTVGTTAPFAVNQTIQCGFAGSKFDSPGCASANEQAFYAAVGLQQMQDLEIALNSQKVGQSLPEAITNAKNSVTNQLFSDTAYNASVNDLITGASANPAKYGLAVTPTTADLTPTKISVPTSISDALTSTKTKANNLINNLADQAVQSDLIGGNITQDVATGITSGLKGEPALNQKLGTSLQNAASKAVNNFPIISDEVQLEADQAMARSLAAAKPSVEVPITPLAENQQPGFLSRVQTRISQTGDDIGTNIKTWATDAQESVGGLLRKLSPSSTTPIAKQGTEPILSSVDQNLVEALKTDKTVRQLIDTENYTEAKNLVADSLTKNLPSSIDSKSPQIQVEIENAAREIANAQTIGGRVTAVENTISNHGYESFGALVDKPTPPNVPLQREINVLGHTQVYDGGIIKPATVSFTSDEVKRIGDNSLVIAQRMQLPASGNIDDVSQIIGSLNKSLADPSTKLGKDQRDLINILYSINSYPEGGFPDILNNFIKNGGKVSDLPQLYADLLSENAGRYKSFEAFWNPVFKTYNDMLPDINAQLPEGVRPIKPIDPESTYWISGTEQNLSGKNCFTGYCSINSPIQDGERNYISMNVNLGLSDDVVTREKVTVTYPSGYTTDTSISIPKAGDIASAGRNDALHVMLHESVHANTLDTIGIYRALPDDNIVTKTLEELTERATIKIEDKLVQQFPEIYGTANRFTAYPTERAVGTGISNALGISEDDIMTYALKQDPIGYINHLDDVYGKLDENAYRNFVDSLYDNLKIGPAQKQFLLENKPPSVMDVRLMVDDWVGNIKFFDRPISGYQGLLNLQKAGYTSYPEEAVSSADAFSRYIESSNNLLNQEGYIPKSFYSQTAEGQYILNYQRPPIPENTTTKSNLIQQIRDFFLSPQSEKGEGITINVKSNGNPPAKGNFVTEAWDNFWNKPQVPGNETTTRSQLFADAQAQIKEKGIWNWLTGPTPEEAPGISAGKLFEPKGNSFVDGMEVIVKNDGTAEIKSNLFGNKDFVPLKAGETIPGVPGGAVIQDSKGNFYLYEGSLPKKGDIVLLSGNSKPPSFLDNFTVIGDNAAFNKALAGIADGSVSAPTSFEETAKLLIDNGYNPKNLDIGVIAKFSDQAEASLRPLSGNAAASTSNLAQELFGKASQFVSQNRNSILLTGFGVITTGAGGYTIAQNFDTIKTGIQDLWQSLPFNKQQNILTTSPQNQSPEIAGVSPANPPPMLNKPEAPQLSFSEKANIAAQNTISSNPFYGIPTDVFNNYYKDPNPTTQRAIFQTYYTQSPSSFEGSGTNFGDPNVAIATLYAYGGFLRQEMQRGWALEASGMYGYHDELLPQLQNFHFIFSNSELNHDDIFLRKQASPLYAYFADQHIDSNGQPIAQTYNQLNENQKRIYDLTSSSAKNFNKNYVVPISTQSSMTPEEALNSGKYVGIIATKSVNDLGRRFLLYKKDSQGNVSFVGVVLVGDYAKLGDWVGSGGVTVQANADFTVHPLGTRTSKGEPWGFDLTQPLYDYYGGSGGPVNGIIAVDPDAQQTMVAQPSQSNSKPAQSAPVNQTKPANNISVPANLDLQNVNGKIVSAAISTMNNCVPGYSDFYNACYGKSFHGQTLNPGDTINANFGSNPAGDPNSLYWCTSLVKDAAKAAGITINGDDGANTMYEDFTKKNAVTLTENANISSPQTNIKPGEVAFVTNDNNPGYISHVGIVSNIQSSGNKVYVTIVQSDNATIQTTYELTENGLLIANENGHTNMIRGFGNIIKYGNP